jgi:hypothetical protein
MTDQTREPADDAPSEPAETEPVATTHPSAPPSTPVVTGSATVTTPRSGLRWGIALLVVALVAVTASAAFFLLSGRAAASPMLAYAPAGSVMYAEIRGDLPGDQRQQLGTFLSAFPGFADQSTLDDKLTETLDRLVRAATDGKHSYATEIKPWWGGAIAIDVPALPDSASERDAFRGAGYLTVTDGAKAQAWIRDQLDGATSSSETYAGVPLTVITADTSKVKGAYGVDGSVLIVGDVDSVKASLDARRHQSGRTSLADDANVRQALAALPADHLVFGFVDNARMLAWSRTIGQRGGTAATPDLSACTAVGATSWAAFTLRADGRTIRMDSIQPASKERPKVTTASSRVASRLPANTIVQADVHDLGAVLLGTLDACRKVPEIAKALAEIDKSVGAIGGWNSLLGWIGDTDIVVTRDGATIAGGVVGIAADKAGAARTLTQIRNLLALAGSTQIAIKDEDYGGTTITTISPSDVQAFGVPASVAFAVRDDLVVIGIGADFVKHVLDVKAGASLADQDRYQQAIGRVDSANEQQFYVDVNAVRSALESAAPAGSVPKDYRIEYKPYLEPFDLVAGSTATKDEVVRGSFVLVVK